MTLPGAMLRIVASNLTTGNNQKYEAPGTRILQGLHPDVVLIQEFNVGDNSPTAVRSFVDSTFGTSFSYYREPTGSIPNGVISRYPIVAAGYWDDDDTISDRNLVWARLDVPGDKDLWAISVHLKADGGEQQRRRVQALALVAQVQANIPAGDYLVVGGDLNTQSRSTVSEPCLAVLSQIVDVAGPWPVDQSADGDTNANRNKPEDWVMLDADLKAKQIPVAIGAASFVNGLVFDSRRYMPLVDVSPVLSGDSGAAMMQHMAVVKDVRLP
jgi:endonuclease/exonuclease/phosphatase family metal-dependent hydrolase